MKDLSLEQKIELAEDAKRYLAPNSLLNVLITQLTKESMDAFVAYDVGSDKARDAHGRIRALNEIKTALKAIIDDVTVATRNRRTVSVKPEGSNEAWNI